MSTRKGAYYERRARQILEAAGFAVTRSGGSLGIFDLIALGPHSVRCIQVKGGDRPYLSPAERERIQSVQVPPNVSRELWRFFKKKQEPVIEIW